MYIFFVCFFSLSQLSEPGRLGTALSGPAGRRASAMTFSRCDTSPTVDCCSFSICWTQSPEELGRVGERSLRSGWTARLSCGDTDFFFLMLSRRRGRGERGDKILRWRHRNCTHYDECRRETAWVFPETFRGASRKTEQPFQAHSVSQRTDKTSLESKRTPRDFPRRLFLYPPFSARTNGAQWRQGESKFLPCFFVAWTQRRLTECFPWATEGPNPPKETLTFKKESFWQTTSGSLPAGLKLLHIREVPWNDCCYHMAMQEQGWRPKESLEAAKLNLFHFQLGAFFVIETWPRHCKKAMRWCQEVKLNWPV